ncbi:hypothetical protein [Caballeronia sp. GAFFF2]|uniref:hypothetical protein n=1 Tax=Caballeronia sp. GAFFF2 TaxID=2921741 RepID=UPI002028A595|nr:hypothetical protein [Caballeronia sp. GAFFF2]
MHDLTSSTWDLGLVGLFQFAPGLATTLVAGHCADRLHRGRMVAACLALQAVAAALLTAATSTHHVTRDALLALSLASAPSGHSRWQASRRFCRCSCRPNSSPVRWR